MMAKKNEVDKRYKAKKRAQLKAKYQTNLEACPEYVQYLEKQKQKMREYRARVKGIFCLKYPHKI